MENRKRIAVAMSGGLDSSVTALLLKERGYDVTGVNLNLWSCFKAPSQRSCCSPDDRRDARKVCNRIGIPFISIDLRSEFKDKVILQFVKDYTEGRTPNPCIRCNTHLKFNTMLSWIKRELNISKMATGHYARIVKDAGGHHLLKGVDHTKDQSYFLFDIDKNILSQLSFPLGEYTKDDARNISRNASLPVAEKRESQEVCFIPDGDIASFIEDYYPDFTAPPGNFVDSHGKVLGKHRGIHAYTIGQRRGLGIGFGKRVYIAKIDPEKNEIMLGEDKDLLTDKLNLINLTLLEDEGDDFQAEVKIRYRTKAVPARIKKESGEGAEIFFNDKVRAVTPGQAAVFYRGDIVLGGGWIA